jgi:hypothetical protein
VALGEPALGARGGRTGQNARFRRARKGIAEFRRWHSDE